MTPLTNRRARVAAAAAAALVAIATASSSAPLAAQQQRAPRRPPANQPPPPAPASFPHSTGEPWRIVQPPQSTQVFARDGTLIGEIGREWRTSVPLRTLPKYVPQAFVAVEDKRFYQHNGVDVIGVLGALKDAVRGDARGASTITQQLVGNMHPDVIDRRDRSAGRKIREQNAALEMERHYTKEQILETYLNLINFGHGWYGIESAARHYFGKGAAQLTLAEAASLASLPKSPVYYDPARFPAKNRERRNTVLALMQEQGYLTDAQARRAMAEPLVTVPNGGMTPAPYFVDVVRQQAERAGVSLASGGYRVVTTLDPALQRAADDALAQGTARLEARPGYRHPTLARRGAAPPSRAPNAGSPYLQGAVVALDPATGDVLALSGGRNYADSPFDRAAYAVRQPGSAFKPVVYAAAIADSIPPTTVVGDTAIAITLENGAVYRPDDADNLFLGEITMREALVKSRNVVAVELAQKVGMDSVIALARRLGISTPISPYPATAIGASGVRPLELVSAYTAFANLGPVAEPRFVARIEDRSGRAVWSQAPSLGAPALSPAVAYVVRDMMRDVVERGTATAVRRALPATLPVAGKTGTTNDNTDVWFVGLTPDVVAGVWLGFDTPKTITPGAAGGSLAAPIFGDMLASWYATHRVPPADAWNTPPQDVVALEVDRVTGRPADDATPADRRYTEYFLGGTEPGAQRVDALKLFQWGPVLF
ncbi:MAG TPA: PBP1A family penicillin-binding protein [Gemmatimonadaceae bacterium]|nr:PBP1A family penicillin-binding protein [Gemmatimonadaceae bacterium]